MQQVETQRKVSFNLLRIFLITSKIFRAVLPRLRCRHKLFYDQTQLSEHPCVHRPKLQGLDGSSSALQSGPWSGVGLIRGQFSLKSPIIGVFERT